jgi:hypothetical protein
MKKLIALFTVLSFTLAAIGQNDTTRYTMVNGYGFTYNRLKAKAALVMPADTIQNKLPGSLVVLNDSLYVRTGVKWEKIGANAAVDTVIISTRAWRQKGDDSVSALVALRVRISDTASMLLPYLRKSDTSAMLSPYFRKGDTVTLSNRINTKLNISDTAAMLAPYAKAVAGLPIGGTTGQILAKNSATNYDVAWIDNYTTDVRETVKATESINKGQAVYVTGADGANVLVSKASNISDATSSKTLGLLFQNLATNGQGFVIIQGRLSGLNTIGATAGDPVWLGTNGNLLYGIANKPVAPAHLVYLGVVTRVNANNGEIFVHVQNGFELEELHDVLITDSVNNQVIAYDSTTRLWKNKTIAQALGYTPANNATTVKYSDTSSMLSPYIRAAGYGLIKSGQSLLVDTAAIATRARVQKAVDSLGAGKTNGSGTVNYVPKWTATSTLGNSQIFDNGTRIGIGTSSPAARLDIRGTSNQSIYLISTDVPDQNNSLESYRNNGGAWSSLLYKGLTHQFLTGPSSGPLAEAMRIFENGRVGINTGSTDAGYQFDVNGTARFQGTIFTRAGTDVGIQMVSTSAIRNSGTQFFDFGTGGSGDFRFRGGSGYNDYLTILNGGNVGIGTTSPATKLHLYGSGNTAMRIESTTSFPIMQFFDTSAVQWNLEHGRSGREFGIYQSGGTGGGTTKFAIAEGGNVGINTTSPSESLDVNGRARVRTIDSTASAMNVLYADATGVIKKASATAFPGGSGTTNVITKWTGSSTLGNSLLTDNGVELKYTGADGLNIQGTTSGFMKIYGTADNYLQFADAAGSAGNIRYNHTNNFMSFQANDAERMRINSLGWVGIATQSPLFPFQVNTYGGIDGNGNQMIIRNNLYYDNTNNRPQPIVSGYQTQIEMNNNDGTMRFSTSSASNTVGSAASIAERMRIWNNGNVGINTTTDAGYRLDVNGSLRSVNGANFATTSGNVGIGTTNPGAKLQINTVNTTTYTPSNTLTSGAIMHVINDGPADNIAATIRLDATGSGSLAASSISGIYTGSASSALTFGTRLSGSSVTERMRIDAAGNVGIGTQSPNTKFHVVGDGSAGPMALFGGARAGALGIKVYNETTAQSSTIAMGEESGTSSTPFFIRRYGSTNANASAVEFVQSQNSWMSFYSNNTERMRIDAAGNVGINTISPTSLLHIYKSNATAKLTIEGAGISNSVLHLKNPSGYYSYLQYNSAGSAGLSIFDVTENVDRLIITSTGNVGIGTTSPTGRMQIQGIQQDAAQTITRMAANNASGQIKAMDFQVNAGSNLFVFNTAYAGTAMGVDFADAGTSRMRIFNSGRIGINTTTDGGYQLDVNGNTRVTGKIDVTANVSIGHNIARSGTSDIAAQIYSSNAWLLYGAESSTGGSILTGSTQYAAVVGSGYNRPLQFGTNSTVRMEIDSTGLVGINTTAPTERLDVNGKARIRTVDSTAGAMNMLYVDATGVIKKTSVPGTTVAVYNDVASIATGSGFTFAKQYTNGAVIDNVVRVEDVNTTIATVTLQIAAYKTTSTFTTGTWQSFATIPAAYAPTTTVYVPIIDYADASVFTSTGGTQFSNVIEYSGKKVMRIDPSGNVDVRIGTVDNSATLSGTNYVLIPVTATWVINNTVF